MNTGCGSKYWRSLSELQQTEEFRQFIEREFPVAASEFPQGVSRRRWMQMMGASLALGGLAGCRWQAEKIAPFAVRPQNRIPGKPEYFATSIEIGGMPRHLLVTCYDGRPIKVEGNPEHPASLGATDTFAQASLLGLYDPDRSDSLRQREGRQNFTRTWEEFETFAAAHFASLDRQSGSGLAVLIEPSSSVTFEAMLARLRQRFPKANLYEYSPLARDREIEGAALAFGRPLRTRFDLTKVRVLACLDADLLGIHPNATRHARDYAHGRDPNGTMNRLYAAESQFSLTGAAADHRLPLKSHEIGLLLAHVDMMVREQLQPGRATRLEPLPSTLREFAQALADDLIINQGASLIAVGSSQPADVHALACDLNATLNNLGVTVIPTEMAAAASAPARYRSWSRISSAEA